MSRPSFLGILTLFILFIASILFQLTMYQRLDNIERSVTKITSSINKITLKQQHAASLKMDLAAPQVEENEIPRKRAHKKTDESATNPVIDPPPPRPTPAPAVQETGKTKPNDRLNTAMVRPEPFDAFEGYDNLQVDEVCRSLGKDTIISEDKKKWTCAD
jgi:uncharacterized membrane protein